MLFSAGSKAKIICMCGSAGCVRATLANCQMRPACHGHSAQTARIKQLVDEGKSHDTILAAFVSEYGQHVLGDPGESRLQPAGVAAAVPAGRRGARRHRHERPALVASVRAARGGAAPAPRWTPRWTPAWTMSSETSTERPESLQPWQLFTLAGLIGATVVVFLSRGQSPAAIILLSCAVFAAAYVGVTALRTVLPLAGTLRDEAPETLGDRTRAALEREKTLVLRSIKELEFDRGMGKVSEKDFAEMSARLRARAARLMRQLDAGSLYREQIEKEVAQRLAKTCRRADASRTVARVARTTCAACACHQRRRRTVLQEMRRTLEAAS